MNIKSITFIFLLLIFYSVGIFGLISPKTRDVFTDLTPYNLLLTFLLYLWSNGDYRFHFFLTTIIIIICGWTLEWTGVKTGILFGNYNYGNTLGLKLNDVPLIIGVNWLLLSYSSRSIFNKLTNNPWFITVLASLSMCLLDLLIEPVAVKFGFWFWQNNVIPFQNYVMWFISSFMLQMIIQKSDIKLKFMQGLVLFSFQFLFFGLLNIFLK